MIAAILNAVNVNTHLVQIAVRPLRTTDDAKFITQRWTEVRSGLRVGVKPRAAAGGRLKRPRELAALMIDQREETVSKKPFMFHIIETQHYEFEIWADDEDEAREKGQKIWRDAPTVGQWELPDDETEYEVHPITKGE